MTLRKLFMAYNFNFYNRKQAMSCEVCRCKEAKCVELDKAVVVGVMYCQ